MKKIFYFLLCTFLLVGITGCGNEVDDNKNNSSNESSQSDTINEKTKIESKTYYCTEKDDDDWYYYFYYENDDLVRTKVMAAKWSGVFEEYSWIKSESEKYNGVSISRDSDYVYYDIDMKKDGVKYLTEMFYGFEDLEKDTSWEAVNSMMQSVASQCVLQ